MSVIDPAIEDAAAARFRTRYSDAVTLRRVGRVLVCSIVSVTTLVACAGDGENAADSTGRDTSVGDLSASIATSLDAIDEAGAVTFTSSEAACTADEVVVEIGEDRLLELGADQGDDLTALGWTTDERAKVFAAIRSCVDLQAQLVELFGADPALDDDQTACIATSYLNSDALPDALFSTEPDSAVNARVDEAIAAAYRSCS